MRSESYPRRHERKRRIAFGGRVRYFVAEFVDTGTRFDVLERGAWNLDIRESYPLALGRNALALRWSFFLFFFVFLASLCDPFYFSRVVFIGRTKEFAR